MPDARRLNRRLMVGCELGPRLAFSTATKGAPGLEIRLGNLPIERALLASCYPLPSSGSFASVEGPTSVATEETCNRALLA